MCRFNDEEEDKATSSCVCVCVFVQGTYGGETYECFENVVEEHQWRNLEQG